MSTNSRTRSALVAELDDLSRRILELEKLRTQLAGYERMLTRGYARFAADDNDRHARGMTHGIEIALDWLAFSTDGEFGQTTDALEGGDDQ
jgi:hypothetical protein